MLNRSRYGTRVKSLLPSYSLSLFLDCKLRILAKFDKIRDGDFTSFHSWPAHL